MKTKAPTVSSKNNMLEEMMEEMDLETRVASYKRALHNISSEMFP